MLNNMSSLPIVYIKKEITFTLKSHTCNTVRVVFSQYKFHVFDLN